MRLFVYWSVVSKVRATALKLPHANATGSINKSNIMLLIRACVDFDFCVALKKLGNANRVIVD